MARAMRASGGLNPNAMRVMRRILVLTDSMRPLDRPCSIAARIDGRCARRCVFCSSRTRDPAAAGPADPPVQGLGVPRSWASLEDQPEAFFEQVGAVQPGVGLGDPGELGLLLVGEVLRVLPQRVAGADASSALVAGRGGASAVRPPGRFGSLGAGGRRSRPARRTSSRASVAHFTTWNGSAQRTAFGQRSATTSAIQSAPSALTWVIWAQPLRSRGASKKASQGGLVPARRGPHQPAACRGRPPRSGTVATLVGDLVDPDPAQPGEPVMQPRRCRPRPGR